MIIEPKIIRPFSNQDFNSIRTHVREVRRIYDWPGIPLHDRADEMKFNRWYWTDLPFLTSLHQHPDFIKLASDMAGRPLKPSYNFASMYNQDGVCPLHTDRPQCQFTIDLQVESDGTWPIYIEEKPYELKDGEALCYSGTGQPHYRKSMKEDGTCKSMNLVFFHFVPVEWMGAIK